MTLSNTILHSSKILLLRVCSLIMLLAPTSSFSQDPIQASGPLIITESNVMVSMRDGINIALDIYRPAQDGSYPTLYSAAPYPHSGDNIAPDNSELGSVPWFVSQGFNYVIASTRGTGLSEGAYEFLSRDEQQDHYELIEWIAEQPWSDGQVIGAGSEYYATAQWQMAIQNPPSLSCIAPVNGIVQPYQDWAFPGGLADTEFLLDWYEGRVRRANAFSSAEAPILIDYDLRLQLLAHPRYDDYWQIRSSLPIVEAINVPVFIIDSWQQNKGISGNMLALERLNSLHKMAIFSSEIALMQNPVFLEEHLLPYYQWCLQNQAAPDFASLPELRYQNRGESIWITTDSWPPQEATYAAVYLNRQELDPDIPATLDFDIQPNNIAVSRYGSLEDTSELTSLTFISDPLASDIEIAGPIMFELYASSSETDTAFEVTLSEEISLEQITSNLTLPDFVLDVIESAANATESTITISLSAGTLKASMRQIEESSQNSYQPNYLFTTAEPLDPSRTTPLYIAMQPHAYRFRAGSRLILTIRQVDDDSLAATTRQDSIFHSQRYPSRIWLPVLAGDLRTVAPISEADLSAFPVDTQSELITNPVSEFQFDTEFSSELNTGELSGSLQGNGESPVIFINPGVTSETEVETTAEDLPASRLNRQ